jgi:hypothetical protein
VLYTGTVPGEKTLTIAGLVPTASYIAEAGATQLFVADARGETTLRIPVHGRTALRIVPAA